VFGWLSPHHVFGFGVGVLYCCKFSGGTAVSVDLFLSPHRNRTNLLRRRNLQLLIVCKH